MENKFVQKINANYTNLQYNYANLVYYKVKKLKKSHGKKLINKATHYNKTKGIKKPFTP